MKYNIKEMIFIALTAALMVAVGYVVFIVANFFPLPGSKLVIMTPFLSFMLTIPIIFIRKIGTVSIISFIFAFIMSFISLFMGLAIFVSGLLTDLLSLIILRNYNSHSKIILSAAFFPVFSMITSFIVTNYITGNKAIFLIGNINTLIIITIIIFSLGILGSYTALKVLPKKVLNLYS